jgi:hypothetical protein
LGTAAQLDFALIEALLELGPLALCELPISLRRAQGPPTRQEVLVVAHQLLRENHDIAFAMPGFDDQTGLGSSDAATCVAVLAHPLPGR